MIKILEKICNNLDSCLNKKLKNKKENVNTFEIKYNDKVYEIYRYDNNENLNPEFKNTTIIALKNTTYYDSPIAIRHDDESFYTWEIQMDLETLDIIKANSYNEVISKLDEYILSEKKFNDIDNN